MLGRRVSTGKFTVLWSNQETYAGPCLLIGKRIITQVHDKDNLGFAVDLLTGKRITRPHPITGEAIPWEYSRNYGCNTALGSAHMLTFRSAAAGYYDLKGDGGTGNFGGFRSGCTSNLIPAGGVLCAPDYTRTCTCAYQNQVSLALVHMPEAEMWTFQKLKASGLPTSRLGLNFGAPGDRFGPDGTLWLDYPSVGGPGPEVKVEKFLEKPEYLRHHASRMEGGDLRWVAASGVKGSGEIAIVLVPPQEKGKEGPAGGGGERHYTVSLVFAEIEGCPAGRRTFDVSVQGQTRLQEFDIAKEAGGAYRTVIREFKDVPVAGALKVSLTQRGELPPLLCGLKIVEGGRGF